jgi:integrase
VIGATWVEIDLAARTWTVPDDRMKGHRAHRIPLSDPAVALLEEVRLTGSSEFVFSRDGGGPLSNMALLMMLRRVGRSDVTAHGFRSSFRTWAAERTSFPREVVEAALAHVTGNRVEAAYQRGDLFDKRRELMAEWGEYCASPASAIGSVVSLKS